MELRILREKIDSLREFKKFLLMFCDTDVTGDLIRAKEGIKMIDKYEILEVLSARHPHDFVHELLDSVMRLKNMDLEKKKEMLGIDDIRKELKRETFIDELSQFDENVLIRKLGEEGGIGKSLEEIFPTIEKFREFLNENFAFRVKPSLGYMNRWFDAMVDYVHSGVREYENRVKSAELQIQYYANCEKQLVEDLKERKDFVVGQLEECHEDSINIFSVKLAGSESILCFFRSFFIS